MTTPKDIILLAQKQSEKKRKWYFNEINRLRGQLSQQQTAFDNFIGELKDKVKLLQRPEECEWLTEQIDELVQKYNLGGRNENREKHLF